MPEITAIVDRLRVRPAQPMGDGEIRDLVRDALLQEPAVERWRAVARSRISCRLANTLANLARFRTPPEPLLARRHPGVMAAPGEQRVAALLDHPAVLGHRDPVGVDR